MSQPLPISTSPPKAAPKAPPKAAPRVAFDPLDPQWRNGARDLSQAGAQGSAGDGASTSSRSAQAPKSAPLDADSLRKCEQADAAVLLARRAFERGEADAARDQLKQAFAIDASSASGLELLGDIFLAEAEQEKAIAVFRRGAQRHPEHLAFEEKIGLALLDIDEEKRDRDIAALLLEHPDSLRWAERKPLLAGSLSLLVPGAGQLYNDEPERGAALFGAAILLFGGWYWLFSSATSSLRGRQIIAGGNALAQMGGLERLGFWVLLLGWMGVLAFAVADAYQGARNANRAHRPFEV